MNTEEMVDILRAEESGQELERRILGASCFWSLHPTRGGLNFADYVYRIKRQPETVELIYSLNELTGRVVIVTSACNEVAEGPIRIIKRETIEV